MTNQLSLDARRILAAVASVLLYLSLTAPHGVVSAATLSALALLFSLLALIG